MPFTLKSWIVRIQSKWTQLKMADLEMASCQYRRDQHGPTSYRNILYFTLSISISIYLYISIYIYSPDLITVEKVEFERSQDDLTRTRKVKCPQRNATCPQPVANDSPADVATPCKNTDLPGWGTREPPFKTRKKTSCGHPIGTSWRASTTWKPASRIHLVTSDWG